MEVPITLFLEHVFFSKNAFRRTWSGILCNIIRQFINCKSTFPLCFQACGPWFVDGTSLINLHVEETFVWHELVCTLILIPINLIVVFGTHSRRWKAFLLYLSTDWPFLSMFCPKIGLIWDCWTFFFAVQNWFVAFAHLCCMCLRSWCAWSYFSCFGSQLNRSGLDWIASGTNQVTMP